MTVLITMAGLGSRFAREGYTVPKYRIQAFGRTLFDWSMVSLADFFQERFVFCTLESEDPQWILDAAHRLGIADARVFARPALSRGQAETAFDALSEADVDSPLWIFNIDTYVAKGLLRQSMGAADGCVEVFRSTDPGMSFVRKNADGAVVEVAEKRPISDLATLGLYGFSSVDLFQRAYAATYESGGATPAAGERYVAPMYQHLINRSLTLVAPEVRLEDVHILGTPAQVREFDPAVAPPVGNGSTAGAP